MTMVIIFYRCICLFKQLFDATYIYVCLFFLFFALVESVNGLGSYSHDMGSILVHCHYNLQMQPPSPQEWGFSKPRFESMTSQGVP